MQRIFRLSCVLIFLLGTWSAVGWGSTYQVLHAFTGDPDGVYPESSALAMDAAGNLYGTTFKGGTTDRGTVYQLSPNPDGSWTETILYSFDPSDNFGFYPVGGLVFDSAGNLYGAAAAGGNANYGTVYELVRNPDGSWSAQLVYAFQGGSDSAGPQASLLFDGVGNLYGTTWGAYPTTDMGSVFKLSPGGGTWTKKTLHTFTGVPDGGNPGAALVMDKSGTLYGTTQYGGTGVCNQSIPGCGTIFSLTPRSNGSWTETVLHNFIEGTDGSHPLGALAFDTSGRLFGMTSMGGTQYGGTAVTLTRRPGRRWTGGVIFQLSDSSAGYSDSTPLLDENGNIYVTVENTDSNGAGAVLELQRLPDGRYSQAVVYPFTGGTDGGLPKSTLIRDAAGNLYGTTTLGGDPLCNCGLVFKITPE